LANIRHGGSFSQLLTEGNPATKTLPHTPKTLCKYRLRRLDLPEELELFQNYVGISRFLQNNISIPYYPRLAPSDEGLICCLIEWNNNLRHGSFKLLEIP